MNKFFKGCSWGKVAAFVAALLFCFQAGAQDSLRADNVVIFDSPDYLMFRWQGDTLDTQEFANFFLFMGKTADTLEATGMKANIVYFLRQRPTEVARVNEALKQLSLNLDDYAAFLWLQEKRLKIVRE